MDRADDVRRVLAGLRFSRKWEPRLVLQVLDASPDTRTRLWSFYWLAKLGYDDARAAFLDLLHTCPREWLSELEDLEPAERLIATFSTLEIVGAPPPNAAEREAALALMAKCEAILSQRLERLAEEEHRQGWEYSMEQLLLRLDGRPLPLVVNLWEGSPR